MRKFFKILIKSVLWLVGVWAVLLITLEVVLSSSVLTGLINKYATEYVDGDLKFGKASVSMFRRFPNVTVSLEDFSITYPADRFGDVERAGESDTLAYFRRFTAALNVPALAAGVVRVPYVGLDKPRIFAHVYADGKANWDIFGSPEEACEIEVVDEAVDEAVDSASASGGPLKLDVGMIRMTGRPHIVYSSVPDSIFAVVNMRRFELRGNMTPKHAVTGKVGLTLDSMFVAGRIGLDTLALGLDRFYIHEEGRQLTVDLAAKTFAALNGYDRMMIPITVNGNVDFPRHEDGIISVKDFCVNVASLPLYADADIQIEDEGIWVDGGLPPAH